MTPDIFEDRRKRLREQFDDGAILLMGNDLVPKNYKRNAYPFRQDSHFLYYTGLNAPSLAAILFADGRTILYGTEPTSDNLVWDGPAKTLTNYAEEAGIPIHAPLQELARTLSSMKSQNPIRYLPPYRADRQLAISSLLNIPVSQVQHNADRKLTTAVFSQRAVKSSEEVAEIEKAISVTARMVQAAHDIIRPGIHEAEIVGEIQKIGTSEGTPWAFSPIVTVRGEFLHNNVHINHLTTNDLVLLDTGVEIPPFHYCSDITRTFPASGRFTSQQRLLYDLVLQTQQNVICHASPRVTNRELHQLASEALVEGLIALGLMKGDRTEAVAAGAHKLLFPHGIGHLLGIDVHDMEDLVDFCTFTEHEQEGVDTAPSNLRLSGPLFCGFVITIEPGLYFNPPLIEQWRGENKHECFINYAEIERFIGIGGIRIEDDILITETGCRLLGPPIEKDPDRIERRE